MGKGDKKLAKEKGLLVLTKREPNCYGIIPEKAQK